MNATNSTAWNVTVQVEDLASRQRVAITSQTYFSETVTGAGVSDADRAALKDICHRAAREMQLYLEAKTFDASNCRPPQE